MRVCKHGCDVLDSRVFRELFYKSNRANFSVFTFLGLFRYMMGFYGTSGKTQLMERDVKTSETVSYCI